MTKILKTEGLSHRYSSNWAIRNIDIEIDEAGITGLLGSNGAGKSTTMNIICGVLNQTEGAVHINGIDLRKQPEAARRCIGFLPQNPPLYANLTVDEYLTYSAELRHLPTNNIPAAVEEVKERCGIAHFSSRLIKNLSGGYRQRVGIAQAIIHKPALVVMDEPTNGLDPNQLLEVRKLIKEIAQDHAVLLSSHILSEIHLLCKNIIMIESGKIVFNDSMHAFDNYLQPQSLLLRLANPPEKDRFFEIKGVTDVNFISSYEVRIHFSGDAEIAERLIEASVAQHWRLQELTMEKNLLDETFKQLSSLSIA